MPISDDNKLKVVPIKEEVKPKIVPPVSPISPQPEVIISGVDKNEGRAK